VTGGVAERLFAIEVAGQRVPGVFWAPAGAVGPRPLVLMGHGGSQHKKVETLVARAFNYVRRLGYAVAAIDAPGHGERATPEEARARVEALHLRIVERTPADPSMVAAMVARARQTVPEWQATLDELQKVDIIGAAGPVGWWGVSMGTTIGVPFVAAESRITAAVFGLDGVLTGDDSLAQAAGQITIPVEFAFQADDELVDRNAGIALFDAFASAEKTLHLNPGGHLGIPSFEGVSWERFFERHLGQAPTSP
jgi:pimeloyl-ACP methyl ester carboxylesterase